MCRPDDHKRAEEILALVAGKELERLGTIDLPADDTALAMVFLAFPAQVAEGFWLAPYVTTEGIRRELGLTLPARVPQPARSSPTWDWKGGAAVTAASARCPFQEAVAESAARFVYGDKPHLSKYAEEVLEISKAPPGTRRSAPAPARGGSGPAPEASPVRDLLQEIQPDGDPLPELLSERLADRLRAAHIVPSSVVNLPTEDLTRIFMNVQDGDLIAKWARYFGVIGNRRFIELWNSTHVSAFLGLVLVKSLSADRGGETVKIAAERGVNPELTASILLSMKRHDNGGLSIGRAIEQGLGNSDSMRNFIAEVFRDDPEFLFDVVLREAGVSDNQILDYIRICYDEWTTYRQLPENESKPIQRAIRLTLIQKAHRLISR